MCIHVHVHCQYSRQYRTPNSPAAHTPHLHVHVPTTCTYMYLLYIYALRTYMYACTYVRTCMCTYMYILVRTYIHTCTHYVHVHVHCTRTFFTFIPILNKHKNYHQNLKLRKVLFIKKFQKGEHKKATTHHTVKTHVSILSIQTCPPLSVLCQKNPYTSD